MKHIALIFFVLSSCKVSVGQELITIRDTINHFSIGVPVGWIYGVPTDKSVTFIAYRQKLNGPDWPKENFNINIIRRGDKDLEKTYKEFLTVIGKVNGFLIIDQADTVINGRRYKSLIETHINPLNNEHLHNYVLFANNNGKILILTMVTTSSNFETFKALFDTIASSLRY